MKYLFFEFYATSEDALLAAGIMNAKGQRQSINIPVAQLYTHMEMTMPVHVLRGKKDGPHLFVCAAIHGDEIIGVEIIRRLLKRVKSIFATT